MDSQAELIKDRLDIVEVISEHVALKRSGQNYKGLCPFHAEKTPSFMVSPSKQIFHCFGCGAGGDVFGFVIKQEGVEFRDALEILAKRAGIELKRQDVKKGEKQSLMDLNEHAMRYFEDCLKRSGTARKYLQNRGIDNAASQRFGLGYAPSGWHNLTSAMKSKGIPEAMLVKAGLAASNPKGAYDIFRDRLMFPIQDARGQTIAFGGRIIGEGEPKYLNSPETPLFQKSETLYALNHARESISKAGFAILVEGYMDSIVCHQFGFQNAVAPLGTALTVGHMKKLLRMADSLTLVFDGDRAGIMAAIRAVPAALAQGFKLRVLMLPEGQDPDSILRAKGAEHFEGILSNAGTPVGFMLEVNKKTGRYESARQAVITAIAPIEDPIYRDEAIAELTDKTGIREQTVREEISKIKKGAMQRQSAQRGNRPYDEETLLLSIALNAPEKASRIYERVVAEDMKNPDARGVFIMLGKGATAADFAGGKGTDSERELVMRMSMDAGFDPGVADEVIEDCIRKIQRRRIDGEINAARKSGDLGALGKLINERQRLTHKT